MNFETFFRTATTTAAEVNGRKPYPYQNNFAKAELLPDRLSVPTGVGKTATVVLGWAYRRRIHLDATIRVSTPRRLVYCLPMRTLVEQTAKCVNQWFRRLGLTEDVGVHLLMGGEDDGDWDQHPEADAVLIGTQDMLLSRALNRGYGMSRYRWPVHFGLLNNDCLWVLDEVQLMGNGLLTTAQLAAFGEKLWPRAKPCQFVWMSATLGDGFLNTRDRRDWEIPLGTKLELSADDIALPAVKIRLRAKKSINVMKDRPKPSLILDEHATYGAGRISLLVFNTVPAARKMFRDLKDETAKPARRKKHDCPDFCLIHGRFRPVDRKRQLDQVDSFAKQMDRQTGSVPDSPGLVLVSTQVVEAGFDISSVRLWSEIAPWSSLVQRLGRLNREGLQPNALATFWSPKEERDGENKPESPNAKRIGPYDRGAIVAGRELLNAVQEAMKAGAEYRDALDQVSQTEAGRAALQVTTDCLIRPDDLLELFATDPDLSGGFTNVSQFVRDSDRNVDTQVFWRDFSPKRARRLHEPQPHRDELCSVPFFELRRFLSKKGVAWEWNGETGRWERRSEKDVWPGMTLLLPLCAGGYSEELGWTGDSGDKPTVCLVPTNESVGLKDEPDSQTNHWYPLTDHLADVEAEVGELLGALRPSDAVARALWVAARWHDRGKALPRWQRAVLSFAERVRARIKEKLEDPKAARFHELLAVWLPKWTPPLNADGTSHFWAKFPNVREIWSVSTLDWNEACQLRQWLRVSFAPLVRHEAASALAAWDAWLSNASDLSALAVYLIASHHGKVRTVLRSTRDNDDVFGLESGDSLPPVPKLFPNSAALHLEAKHLGAHGTWNESGTEFEATSPSWTEVVADLLGPAMPGANPSGGAIPQGEPQNLGPFALAFYEAILVASDIRASRQPGKSKRV